MLQMKKVLVTGAAGFVGAHLVKKLLDLGYEVHCIVRASTNRWRLQKLHIEDRCVWHEVDLTDREATVAAVKLVQPTYVFHLATRGAYPTQNHPQDLLFANSVGTWNLFQALIEVGCELCVQTGSSSEYGFSSVPMKESDLPHPNSWYAVTKSSNTLLGGYLGESGLLPVVTVRLFSVYGLYEEPTRLFPTLVAAVRTGTAMSLASLQTARDYIYIDDVVHMLTLVDELLLHPGKVYNCGTGTQTTLGELVATVEAVTHQKLTIARKAYPARSWDSSCWVADMSQTFSDTTWRPRFTIEEGFAELWKKSG